MFLDHIITLVGLPLAYPLLPSLFHPQFNQTLQRTSQP